MDYGHVLRDDRFRRRRRLSKRVRIELEKEKYKSYLPFSIERKRRVTTARARPVGAELKQ